MPNPNTRQAAHSTIVRIFEDAAFIFTDAIEEKPAAQGWNAWGVSINFAGKTHGSLRMWAGEDFCRYAAANMLGMDESTNDAARKGLDALKELLNMVAGNLLTELYGDKLVFDLGLPEVLQEAALLAGDVQRPDAIWLGAEGRPVLFVVDIA